MCIRKQKVHFLLTFFNLLCKFDLLRYLRAYVLFTIGVHTRARTYYGRGHKKAARLPQRPKNRVLAYTVMPHFAPSAEWMLANSSTSSARV